MYITSDIFIKYYEYLNFSGTQDICKNNSLCSITTDKDTCDGCIFYNKNSPNIEDTCMTEFKENPDLQKSIDDFKIKHPELLI